MAVSIWKKDVENTIEVDLGLNDIYGATGFNLYTKYKDDTSPTKEDVEFSEVIEDISDPISVTATEEAKKGTYEIKVDDTSNIEVGMRFKVKDKNIYFYVSKVTDNSVIVRRALSDDIAKDDELNQVGNMGIYEAKYTPTKKGALIFVVNNPSIGLQDETAKVEVSGELIDDVASDLASSYNDLSDKISDIQSALGTAGADIVRGKILV